MKAREITYKINRNGCWECTSHKPTNEGYVFITENGIRKFIHRKMYEDFKEVIPDGMIIRHTCDNRKCINPNHLITGTRMDNVKDRVERGRSAIGESNGRSKLNEYQVIEIRNNSTLTRADLARKYNVDAKVIRDILNGITWRYLL